MDAVFSVCYLLTAALSFLLLIKKYDSSESNWENKGIRCNFKINISLTVTKKSHSLRGISVLLLYS